MNPAHAHLDRVVALQEGFKPGKINAFAVRILTHALAHGSVWPDEVSLKDVSEKDRRCIGNAWRRLRSIGLIEQMNDHRSSEADGRKGGTIFRYRLVDRTLAQTFVERNTPFGEGKEKQLELMQ